MMTNEVRKLMTNLQEDGTTGEVSANFTFPRSFLGFKGHFPQESILPGVCQIEMILTVIAAHQDSKVKLSNVSRAKFLNVVRPEECIKICGFYSVDDDIITAKFKITKIENSETINVSRISLQCEIHHL